jgi:ABC-type dipeptide/oligopeptide/nickel transport system permease component
MAGPLFQPLRGLLFGLVFYSLRESLFGKKHGWLVMWSLLVTVGIVNTFGPSPGSIEGLIYTVFPASVHLRGLPEVLVQSLLLSALLAYWMAYPEKKWFTRVMVTAFLLMLGLPALGLLVGRPA